MKILCIVNNVMPKLAEKTGLNGSASGSWLIDITDRLSVDSNVELAIATVGGNIFNKTQIDGVTYYLLPGTGKNLLFYTKKYEKLWKKISEEFKPDIVHLYGTEYSHGLSFLRANSNVPAVVSIQGVLAKIKDVLYDGLPKFFDFRYSTLKERLRFGCLRSRILLYKKNSKYEKEILNRVKYASNVNAWDYSATKSMNPNLKYFQIEYNLRKGFYSAPKWNKDNILSHSIFVAPGSDPVKGLHVLIKAVANLKNIYNDISVTVPGIKNVNGKLYPKTGYVKYINKLIKKYDLASNFNFVGNLSEEQMIDGMLKSNVLVVPSQMEGTSLILREGAYLGVPTVASFRGGMADFIEDKKTGFLYDFFDYDYLSMRLSQIFEDVNLADKLSKNAISKAEKLHDPDKNYQDTINMYQQIIKENN